MSVEVYKGNEKHLNNVKKVGEVEIGTENIVGVNIKWNSE